MARHNLQRLLVKGKVLLLTDVTQARLDVFVRDAMEVETLAARKNGLENLLRIGGAQNEHHVRRRLLKGLEQRVERRRREHVNLVDDVDLVGATNRRVAHRVDNLLAHIVHTRARCRVKLVDIRMITCGNGLTLRARTVWDATSIPFGTRTQQRLSQNARHGGLARTAWTTK